jgi:O-antigen ligase
MELTDSSTTIKFSRLTPETLLLGCLLILPYASYAALGGLFVFLLWTLKRHGSEVAQLLYRQGWLWLFLAMVVNILVSQAPLESALQSMNFWPFFILYGAIATLLNHSQRPIHTLKIWATGLVIASIPISARSLVEYYFKAPANLEHWLGTPWLNWLYLQPDFGHRADSVFGHPNVLANYLMIMLGLGLGLWAAYLQQAPKQRALLPWIGGATGLILIAIFCSGSRNGLLVAGLQIVGFGWLMRRYRYIMLAGLGSLLAVALGVFTWGIGGRSLFDAFATITLRFDVWRLAAEMIRTHPWLGSGLGTFKLQYEPYSIPIYESVEHAHNLWLMLATEMGLIFTLGFVAIVWAIVQRSLLTLIRGKMPVAEKYMLAGYYLSFAGILVFAMFDLSFYDSRVNVLGWLLLAVIQAVGHQQYSPTTDALQPSQLSP